MKVSSLQKSFGLISFSASVFLSPSYGHTEVSSTRRQGDRQEIRKSVLLISAVFSPFWFLLRLSKVLSRFSQFFLPNLICIVDSASVKPFIFSFLDALLSSASDEMPESVTSQLIKTSSATL